jgi:hypothetical protein
LRTAWPVRADFNERHCGGCQNGDVRETGLLVEVPEAEHLVASWRARYDPVTTRGIPAHVTALWPFVAPEEIDAAVIDGLRAALRTVEPFEFELDHVNEFPGVVWLHPEPDVPFRSLTRAIWMAFPDYPPYRGAFPDSQPHLTVGLADSDAAQQALLRQLDTAFEGHLPIRGSVTALSVFTSDSDGFWTRILSLPLGT